MDGALSLVLSGYITRLWRGAFPSRRERSVRGLSSKFTGVSRYTSAFSDALAKRGASSFKGEVTQMMKKKKWARLRHQHASGSPVKRGSARCGVRWCPCDTWNIHPRLWGVGSNLSGVCQFVQDVFNALMSHVETPKAPPPNGYLGTLQGDLNGSTLIL